MSLSSKSLDSLLESVPESVLNGRSLRYRIESYVGPLIRRRANAAGVAIAAAISSLSIAA